MTDVRIHRLEWLDKTAKEAILTISDGVHQVRCFSHPHEHAKEKAVQLPLLTLGAECVRRSKTAVGIEQDTIGFSLRVRAEVVDTHRPTVSVGALLFELDTALPGDIQEGDVVEFCVDRLDYIGG